MDRLCSRFTTRTNKRSTETNVNYFRFFSALALFTLSACSNPQSGPDKTVAGAVLGAGWGAGAGAVVGNQLDYSGSGMAVGAGFGAVGGALSGMGYDLNEGAQLKMKRELKALKVQNAANSRELQNLQARMDNSFTADLAGGFYQVFFDADSTSLRSGAIANLEAVADSLRTSPVARTITVLGHTDDSGAPEYNARLAEGRARTVASYLASRGLSVDQIVVKSFGSTRPVASNGSEPGRQLNRRVDLYVGK